MVGYNNLMPEFLSADVTNAALERCQISSRFASHIRAWVAHAPVPGSYPGSCLFAPFVGAEGQATCAMISPFHGGAISKVPESPGALPVSRPSVTNADEGRVWPGMALDEIAALTCLKDRALALTFTAVDRRCPRAWALVRSVDVPEAGDLGKAVQATLSPPPKKKRATRVPKPICPDSMLKDCFNLFSTFADEELVAQPPKVSSLSPSVPGDANTAASML